MSVQDEYGYWDSISKEDESKRVNFYGPQMKDEDILSMQTYEPEIWQVKKDTIYAAITAVEDGLEFAKSSLQEHDLNFGRTTKKNKTWAEAIEASIRHMELTLAMLKQEPQN